MTRDPAVNGVVSAEAAAASGMPLDRLALELVPFARDHARPAVSGFKVGAVAVGPSGALYYGANLEIAGQPLATTLHAEQSALSNAWLNGETALAAIAVSAAPCGHCRQFLWESAGAARLNVLLAGGAEPLSALLPSPFGPADLGVSAALMSPEHHGLSLGEKDDLASAALDAANRSYSPYTRSFSGVALRTGAGIVTGRYAENAAFNPSLSATVAALSQAALRGAFDGIEEAVLVHNGGPADPAAPARDLFAALGVPLRMLRAAETRSPAGR